MMAKTSRQFKQQKQYTKDKGKEATEVTLKAYKKQNMHAGNRWSYNGYNDTMSHQADTSPLTDINPFSYIGRTAMF